MYFKKIFGGFILTRRVIWMLHPDPNLTPFLVSLEIFFSSYNWINLKQTKAIPKQTYYNEATFILRFVWTWWVNPIKLVCHSNQDEARNGYHCSVWPSAFKIAKALLKNYIGKGILRGCLRGFINPPEPILSFPLLFQSQGICLSFFS